MYLDFCTFIVTYRFLVKEDGHRPHGQLAPVRVGLKCAARQLDHHKVADAMSLPQSVRLGFTFARDNGKLESWSTNEKTPSLATGGFFSSS